jgi:hypothetical protein
MLTDAQIAVVCDIGQSIAFGDEKCAEFMHLMADGYIKKVGDIFELTPKGEKILTERGAGLNEA